MITSVWHLKPTLLRRKCPELIVNYPPIDVDRCFPVDVAAGYLTCYSICSADLWSEGLVCAQELIPTMNEFNSMCFV
jgi:hypothetical protein